MAERKVREFELIHSFSIYNTVPPYTMRSEYPANSKKWIEQVMEIERQTGATYHWYWSHRNYARPKMIDRTRFRWWR